MEYLVGSACCNHVLKSNFSMFGWCWYDRRLLLLAGLMWEKILFWLEFTIIYDEANWLFFLISREAVKDRLLAGYWIWKIPGPGTSRITYFAWQLIVFIHTWLKENKRATENQLTSAALVRTRVRQEHVVRLVQGHEGSLKSKIQLGLDTKSVRLWAST